MTRAIVGRAPGEPNTRWTSAPTPNPSSTPANKSFGKVTPRYIAATPSPSTSVQPNTRVGRATYGLAALITATVTAIRTAGNAGEPPRLAAMRTLCAKASCATTIWPIARAVPHARSPAIDRTRASRHRLATSAATTTRPTAHSVPRRYRPRNTGVRPFGNVLNRSNAARSLAVTLPAWCAASTKRTATTAS